MKQKPVAFNQDVKEYIEGGDADDNNRYADGHDDEVDNLVVIKMTMIL